MGSSESPFSSRPAQTSSCCYCRLTTLRIPQRSRDKMRPQLCWKRRRLCPVENLVLSVKWLHNHAQFYVLFRHRHGVCRAGRSRASNLAVRVVELVKLASHVGQAVDCLTGAPFPKSNHRALQVG
jgi:hypothetical protein